MKKQIFLIGAIAIMGLGIFLASCKKEEKKEEEFRGCSCKVVDVNGYASTETFSAAQVTLTGTSDCSKYADIHKELNQGYLISVICTNL